MVAALASESAMAAGDKGLPFSMRGKPTRRVCDVGEMGTQAPDDENFRNEYGAGRPWLNVSSLDFLSKLRSHSDRYPVEKATLPRGMAGDWSRHSEEGCLCRGDVADTSPPAPSGRVRSLPRHRVGFPEQVADLSVLPGSQEIQVGLNGRMLGEQYSISCREICESYVAGQHGATLLRSPGSRSSGNSAQASPSGAARQLSDAEIDNIRVLVADAGCSDAGRRRAAAVQLRQLAKVCDASRGAIVAAGGVAPLIRLLQCDDEEAKGLAVIALLNLSINVENKRTLPAQGAVEGLVEVLASGAHELREHAAAALFSLSVVDENKVLVGAAGAAAPLVALLAAGETTEQGRRDACKALFNLSILSANKAKLIAAGSVRPLVAILQEPSAAMAEKAVSVLANLATAEAGRAAIAAEDEGVSGLVEVVEAGTARGKENAASALWQLCQHSSHHRNLIRQEVVIPPLFALSQTGTPRAKDKANLLLANLQEGRHAASNESLSRRSSMSSDCHSFD